MRIDEIRVNSYGPIHDRVLRDMKDFTLIFGKNESGKTLLLDALLRFLMPGKRDQKLFKYLDRVVHDPDGYVQITVDGDAYRIPGDGSLEDLLCVNSEDLRNVFVVRASDLVLDNDSVYFQKVTDRLMGIHRDSIRALMDEIRKIGKITDGGALSNTADQGKLANRVRKARELQQKISEFHSSAGEEDLAALEEELFRTSHRKEEVESGIQQLKLAMKREKFESGLAALEQLKTVVSELSGLPEVSQDDYNTWRDAERTISDEEADISELEEEIAKIREEVREAESSLKEAQESLRTKERKQGAVQELDEQVSRYREKHEGGTGCLPVQKIVPWLAGGSFLLLVLSLVGVFLMEQKILFGISAGLAGLILLVFVISLVVVRFQEGQQKKAWERIRLKGADLGLDSETLESLLGELRKFSEDFQIIWQRVSNEENRVESLKTRIEKSSEQIEDGRKKIAAAHDHLHGIRQEKGIHSFEEFESVQEKRQQAAREKDRLIAVLSAVLGTIDGAEDPIDTWKKKLGELEPFRDAAQDISFNEDTEAELEEKLQMITVDLRQLQESLAASQRGIQEIASEANRLLSPDQMFPGDTTEDLEAIEKELEQFVRQTEDMQDLAVQAVEILKTLQAEEEQKVQELFTEGDEASRLFGRITGGAYSGMFYDPGDKELKVRQKNGDMLRAYTLSSGTYDQLYLATRISLAGRILQDQTGFLLLDDPFLTSDTERLTRQLDILAELAAGGWQILYFSVKDEVRDLLGKRIKKGEVVLEEMERVHADR